MWINNALPFSSSAFFIFMAIVVALFYIAKKTIAHIIPYKYLILTISIIYLSLLFTKPFHIFGLIVYLYGVLSGLRRWYKSDNIVFPMVILSLPMLLMKFFTNITFASDNWWKHTPEVFQIAGISYMVFRVISLYVDERSNSKRINFIDFFNFTSFIPTLLIGPLTRFGAFTANVTNGYESMNRTTLQAGWINLLQGLLYKFILAKALYVLILSHLEDNGTLFYHLSYMYTYLLYLFFDFAGYSLLAISFGNFIGIHVPINFNKPFLAINPKEFWQRWHKSLGDWLNDYFFKPLFKYFTQKKWGTSIQRQGLALFLTFTLMGFWNGFEVHFILSGMLFGLFSVIHNYYSYLCKKNKIDVLFGNSSEFLVKIISIFMMFNAVAFSIYIFSGKLF